MRNIDIDFKKDNNDLHIFIGRNGSGKTNFMNAINWCLYADEPHLSKNSNEELDESEKMPLVNLNALSEKSPGEKVKVEVELWIDIGSETVVFKRTMEYQVEKIGVEPKYLDSNFEVQLHHKQGNVEFFEREEARDYVERFVPKNIREFFFFDGERLDKYFIDSTGDKIKKNTFDISRIDLLEKVGERLETLSRELTREASRNNPDLEKTNETFEKYGEALEEINKQIEECNKNITLSRNIIRDIDDYLAGIPDIEKEENELKILDKKGAEKQVKYEYQKQKKQDILMDYGILLNLWSTIKNTVDIINTKRENNELPPNINLELLEDILEKGVCKVCGRALDTISINKIEDTLNKITLSSSIAQKLIEIESPLKMLLEKVNSLKKALEEVNKEIVDLEEEMEDIEERKNEINKKISGYDDREEIKKKYKERLDQKEVLESNIERRATLIAQKKNVEKEYDKAKEALAKALKMDQQIKNLTKQIEFCNKAINVIERSKNKIMNDVRLKIEKGTKEIFFNLIWKKDTFKDIVIDDNYNLKLYHVLDYECLDTISAAERELLALSFTLALHKVSGFEFPIIIDTPVARVSDTNRENFAKVLLKVCEMKQVILLFTPDEFSKNIEKTFTNEVCNKYKLNPSNERETKLEVII